ncbi:cytochrome c peroxidase [Variovorax humicola]|uniref:Cytochrome c peroxidase n=1 Tax=Variovorax humicola TaxID=1769758 RepID=A0ABU8VVS6_9BURK
MLALAALVAISAAHRPAAATDLAVPVEKTAPPAHAGAAYAPATQGKPQASAAQLTELGRLIFSDASLSASGRMSCASCHDPRHAYGPPNALSVQTGGPDLRTPGLRASPSLRYLQTLAAFTEHHHDNDGDDSIDAGPTGGRMWDGRAGSAHEQAGMPLLSPAEMANESKGAVARKLARAAYADKLRAAFGNDLFADPASTFRAASMALEVFQQSPADFYPFDSKYDAYLRGQQKLSAAETRGLRLFNDSGKGNCASCHISAVTADGAFPLFTDFGLIAIGVPRNRRLPANADPAFHDLGLCGPIRTDFRDRPEYCGLFRTPSLRNVAVRQSFFHNGVFHSLEEAVRFYAERDTHPARWYPRGRDGRVRKFDDLPPAYHDNLNADPPFDRLPGDRPALTNSEVRDVVAFLRTLTDADQLRAATGAAPRPPR